MATRHGNETMTLWGSHELCTELGFGRSALKYHRDSGELPAPVASLMIGDVWDAAEVRAWWKDRTTGRQLRALREYRKTGSIRAAARAVDVSPPTVRRWLRTLGEPTPTERTTT